LLEAESVLASNQQFHLVCNKVMNELDYLDSKIIYNRWIEWFKEVVK